MMYRAVSEDFPRSSVWCAPVKEGFSVRAGVTVQRSSRPCRRAIRTALGRSLAVRRSSGSRRPAEVRLFEDSRGMDRAHLARGKRDDIWSRGNYWRCNDGDLEQDTCSLHCRSPRFLPPDSQVRMVKESGYLTTCVALRVAHQHMFICRSHL